MFLRDHLYRFELRGAVVTCLTLPPLILNLSPSLAAKPSYRLLESASGEVTFGTASAISSDGRWVVGDGSFGVDSDPHLAIVWDFNSASATRTLAPPPGNERAYAFDVSADGKLVVGMSQIQVGLERSAIAWAVGAEPQFLPPVAFDAIESGAEAISANGEVVVGWSYSEARHFEPTVWINGFGAINLNDLNGSNETGYAISVSDDGQVIVGLSGQNPVIWRLDGTRRDLAFPAGDTNAQAEAVSSNGEFIAGLGVRDFHDPGDGQPYSRSQLVRWSTEGDVMALGNLSGSNAIEPTAISANGRIICGMSISADGYGDAFIWRPNDGIQLLRDVLVNEYRLGDELAGWRLESVTDMTSDGKRFVGAAVDDQGRVYPFVVSVPEPNSLTLIAATVIAFSISVIRSVGRCLSMLTASFVARTTSRRSRSAALSATCGAIVVGLLTSVTNADSKSAETALKDKGLKRVGVSFCVPEEQELARILKETRAMQKDLLVAERNLYDIEAQAANAKQYVQECFRRRAELTRQLANAPNVKVHNQMVAAINELEAEIVRLENGEEMKKAVDSARAAAAAEREKYVQHLLEARALVTKAEAEYQSLAADNEVTSLIAEFNEGQTREAALGPSRGFLASVKALVKLEEKVLSEEIPLRREGGLFFVPVVFNGEAANTHEMAIDTGASIVSLPYALAKAVGLEPNEQSEVMRMEMADGSIVPGRKVIAKELRVGKFIVENVECVVMPAELPNAAPLLGQTFLDKFGYKIDSDQQKLVMSKVEAASAPARNSKRQKSRAAE